MTITKPTITKTLKALLVADFSVFKSNYRSLAFVLVIPVVLIFAYHKAAKIYGADFLIAIAITVALLGIGLISYPMATARDRDLGIFQRLRITPTPTWAIMSSRIVVQIASAIASMIVAIIAGIIIYTISPSVENYVLILITTLFASALYLSIGQLIVGLIKSADTINAASRFIYIPTLLLGMLGELGILGSDVQNIVKWSPFGTIETLFASSFNTQMWNNTTWLALLITVGYIAFFAFIGIRLFQWDSK